MEKAIPKDMYHVSGSGSVGRRGGGGGGGGKSLFGDVYVVR